MRKRFCTHRGVSALMPENTLPAFAAAIALGADKIEPDVCLTRDQQLIVSHDGTLERISNGQGSLSDYMQKAASILPAAQTCWNGWSALRRRLTGRPFN